MEHTRFVHSQLANNIQEVMQLVKANDTTEVLNLLDGMKMNLLSIAIVNNNAF